MYLKGGKSMDNTPSLIPLTESSYADFLRAGGQRVIQHRGRHWKSQTLGFYQPIHYLARLTRREATRPNPMCWGFRSTLCNEDAPLATGALPVHVLTDLAAYDLDRLKKTRRAAVRKCWNSFEITEITEPDLLHREAYGIVQSDHARHRYGKLPGRREYLDLIDRFFQWKFVVLGGFREGRLGGFVVGGAIGETAYLEEIQIHSDFLKMNLASGLTYELGQVCKQTTGIKELVHGLHARENHSLCYLKEDLGFKVRRVPSYHWFAPLCATLVRWRRPHVYYRLCGRD